MGSLGPTKAAIIQLCFKYPRAGPQRKLYISALAFFYGSSSYIHGLSNQGGLRHHGRLVLMARTKSKSIAGYNALFHVLKRKGASLLADIQPPNHHLATFCDSPPSASSRIREVLLSPNVLLYKLVSPSYVHPHHIPTKF